METLKARRSWSEVFWEVNENNFNPRILYPGKLSFKVHGARKIFPDKQKLKQYITTKPPLQKILQGILYTENESIQNHERAGSINLRRRKGKKVESNTDSVAQNQTHKQQRQLNDGITTYLSKLTLNVNGLNSPIKRHSLANWIKKEDPTICCLRETHLIERNKHWLRVKG
jgi:hypothetical protein